MDDTPVPQEHPPIDSADSKTVVSTPAQNAELRMQRILEYLDNSLTKADAMLASLGAVNSDLLVLAYRLKKGIDEQLEAGSAGLSELAELMPAIEVLLKLAKQIDRYANLSLKLEKCPVESLPALPLPSP